MQRRQWAVTVLVTATLIALQFAHAHNLTTFSLENALWSPAEWLPTPSIPIASTPYTPVTADMSADETFIYSSYQPYESGLLVRVEDPQAVLAKSDGMILFTGEKRKTGKTMTVAYDSGDTVTYGFLKDLEILPYTRFTKGEVLGHSSTDLFYIHHDNHLQPLDPESLMMWLTME